MDRRQPRVNRKQKGCENEAWEWPKRDGSRRISLCVCSHVVCAGIEEDTSVRITVFLRILRGPQESQSNISPRKSSTSSQLAVTNFS